MGVRTYVRSPAAIAWTLAAVVGIGATVTAGWELAVVLASSSAIADTAVLGELGAVVLLAVVLAAVAAVSAAVWLPCAAAIAYAVGRRVRGHPASIPATLGVVRARSEPLYRWAKTTVAVGALADRLLTENDTAPAEIAAGCGGFVLPAIVLDAPTLSAAVDRANRVVPRPGRERVQFGGLVGTAALAAGGWGLGTALDGPLLVRPVAAALPPSPALLVAGVVVGLVATAALDTAWRAGAYAASDPDEGFAR
jgi:hypothetical protein